MKRIIFLAVAAGILSSCAKKSDSGGEVPYKPCPCEEVKTMLDKFQGEAYFFRDFIPEQEDLQIRTELSNGSHKVYWIVFDSKTGLSELTVGQGVQRGIGEICNFPEFAEEWNIPENGCKVYFEAEGFEACAPKGGIGTISYFDFILKNLKRK